VWRNNRVVTSCASESPVIMSAHITRSSASSRSRRDPAWAAGQPAAALIRLRNGSLMNERAVLPGPFIVPASNRDHPKQAMIYSTVKPVKSATINAALIIWPLHRTAISTHVVSCGWCTWRRHCMRSASEHGRCTVNTSRLAVGPKRLQTRLSGAGLVSQKIRPQTAKMPRTSRCRLPIHAGI